jgi:hypothetical protein
MVAIVDPGRTEAIAAALTGAGETVYRLGRVVPRPLESNGTVIRHMEAAWPG